jgi:hypothetical protein
MLAHPGQRLGVAHRAVVAAWSPAALAGRTGLTEAVFRASRDALATASPEVLAQVGGA